MDSIRIVWLSNVHTGKMIISYRSYWRELASGSRTGMADSVLVYALTPLAWLYSLAVRMRAALYRSGILKTVHLPRPVVSIGNITVGGTGKTPVTSYIARFLLSRGYRVAVLSRGYGGSLEGQTCVVSDGATVMLSARESGDEPYLLASTLPGLMVVIGTDRFAAGQLAMQQLSPEIFLLDDGFQHLRLHRDLNILLLDHARPFGNGWTLPAGILREPANAKKRAGLIVQTRCPEGAPTLASAGNIPNCNASHRIVDFLPLSGSNPAAPVPAVPCKALAFAGIADPTGFFEELRSLGFDLVHTVCYPDHMAYTEAGIAEMMGAMRHSGAEVAITTEKDGVKLTGFADDFRSRVLLARMELVIDDPSPLLDSICNLLHNKP